MSKWGVLGISKLLAVEMKGNANDQYMQHAHCRIIIPQARFISNLPISKADKDEMKSFVRQNASSFLDHIA